MVIKDFSGNIWNVEIWGTDWNPKVKKQIGEEIEIILATNPTMEGEATALYIKKKLELC